MARIVIVAQRSELFIFVEHILSQDGDSVRFVVDPGLATTKINAVLPDLVIVDASNRGSANRTRGLRTWVRNRHRVGRTPVLILGTAADANAWGISVKDVAFLERPLQPQVLLARVQKLLASNVSSSLKSQIVVADLVIDPTTYRVVRSGKLVSLSPLEFRLLYYFASHPNTILRRDQLLSVVSNPNTGCRGVDVYVHHLRKKIEEDPRKPRLIRIVRQQGYRFHTPAQPCSSPLSRDCRCR